MAFARHGTGGVVWGRMRGRWCLGGTGGVVWGRNEWRVMVPDVWAVAVGPDVGVSCHRKEAAEPITDTVLWLLAHAAATTRQANACAARRGVSVSSPN